MKRIIEGIQLSLKFPRNEKIRRMINEASDVFGELYNPPLALPIPDYIDPVFPRITLDAINGHSQIIFSQVSVDLNVNFDDEFSDDYTRCEIYIKDRITLLINFLNLSDIESICYMGITTKLKYQIEDEADSLVLLKKAVSSNLNDFENLYDYNQKVTILEEEEYFHNITVGKYDDFIGDIANEEIQPLKSFSNAKIVSKGISVVLDINDRYGYLFKGIIYDLEKATKKFEYILNSNQKWIDERIESHFHL